MQVEEPIMNKSVQFRKKSAFLWQLFKGYTWSALVPKYSYTQNIIFCLTLYWWKSQTLNFLNRKHDFAVIQELLYFYELQLEQALVIHKPMQLMNI